jgi:Uma2 family endonuclease
MTTIPPSAEAPELAWTKEEYYRLGELGFFRGRRVELIGGMLMVLSPQGAPHGAVLAHVARILEQVFASGCHVRWQLPLDLGATSEPEPDIAVVVGQPLDYLNGHPADAILVVEVSDTMLAYDRGRKASLYASVGIRDYWIINLVTPQVEVYRDPIPDANEPFGHRYGQRTDLLPGDTVSPLALSAIVIPVVDLLP